MNSGHQLCYVEDVLHESREDGEEVVEDGLVQAGSEDDVGLQQLQLRQEQGLGVLLDVSLRYIGCSVESQEGKPCLR